MDEIIVLLSRTLCRPSQSQLLEDDSWYLPNSQINTEEWNTLRDFASEKPQAIQDEQQLQIEQNPKILLHPNNVGSLIMKKIGYKEGKGLGIKETGNTTPVATVIPYKDDRT